MAESGVGEYRDKALHKCLKDLGHPGRHSDGAVAWETEVPPGAPQYELPLKDRSRSRKHEDGGFWTESK